MEATRTQPIDALDPQRHGLEQLLDAVMDYVDDLSADEQVNDAIEELVTAGYSDNQIADALDVSRHRVESVRSRRCMAAREQTRREKELDPTL